MPNCCWTQQRLFNVLIATLSYILQNYIVHNWRRKSEIYKLWVMSLSGSSKRHNAHRIIPSPVCLRNDIIYMPFVSAKITCVTCLRKWRKEWLQLVRKLRVARKAGEEHIPGGKNRKRAQCASSGPAKGKHLQASRQSGAIWGRFIRATALDLDFYEPNACRLALYGQRDDGRRNVQRLQGRAATSLCSRCNHAHTRGRLEFVWHVIWWNTRSHIALPT